MRCWFQQKKIRAATLNSFGAIVHWILGYLKNFTNFCIQLKFSVIYRHFLIFLMLPYWKNILLRSKWVVYEHCSSDNKCATRVWRETFLSKMSLSQDTLALAPISIWYSRGGYRVKSRYDDRISYDHEEIFHLIPQTQRCYSKRLQNRYESVTHIDR